MAERARRATIFVALILVLGLLAGASPAPQVTFEIKVPVGTYPTIVTHTDNSGLYKLERVSANAFRIVNFDRKAALVIAPEPGRTSTDIGIANTGSNGPDPVPGGCLTVLFVREGRPEPNPPILHPGQDVSCVACDGVHVKIGTP